MANPAWIERRWVYLALSALILAPCFWHARIHAGDLSSHAYNAWLALETERGNAPGLYLVQPWTNVLFDVMLAESMRWFGPDWAQRLSVAACVLVFFWGAFAWVRVWVGDAVWKAVPVIALAAYGWVFHVGFFNFYLGLGLGLAACAVMRNVTALRCAAALVLLLLSVYAHALAAAAACALLVWQFVSERANLRVRRVLVVLAVLALGGVKLLFGRNDGGPKAIGVTTIFGADQLDHLGLGTTLIAFCMVFFVAWLVANFAMREGVEPLLGNRVFELFVLLQAAAWLLPHEVQFEQYAVPLSFIQERFSLMTLISAGMVLSTVMQGRWPAAVLGALSICQFGVMYYETSGLERVESGLAAALEQVPSKARVISTLRARGARTDQFMHMVDRACLGRCYSFANYEVRSTQFRLRAREVSPFTMPSKSEIWAAELGTYVFKAEDLPVWLVRPSEEPGRFEVYPVRAGDQAGREELSPRLNALIAPARR